ncbi:MULTISPECIES: MFS transporter [unclassified Streptomyces]|uniref:MFS transporter n=1 Tax=unclassified Streptomyces TaxID=2593676 RepID=UPI000BACE64A|nr:MFS transporter [Streptomyces sp. CLI2509]ASY34337.1 MFS transporter [Streptomyces sp. CLI2509]MYX24146.1 MFS transporter [Streptomyces sp. SID8380]
MATTVASSSGTGSPKDAPPRRPGYGQLLRTPGIAGFLLSGFAARQPFGMLTMGMVMLVEHTTGSYGNAGAVAAVTGVSMAVFAPQNGRLADRHGQRAVLVPGVILHAVSVAALAALALADAPLWALFLLAVPAGASVPQVGPMVRARWAGKLAGSPLLPTATAFESVTDEFTFVIGPVLATALCTGVHPVAGLAAEATLTLVGGLLFAAQRAGLPGDGHPGPATGPDSGTDQGAAASGQAGRGAAGSRAGTAGPSSALRVPGVRVLIVAFLGIGVVFGGMQVSLTAFAEESGHSGVNGLLYGIFACGNMLSGAAVGAIAWKRPAHGRLLVGYTALAVVASTLWAVHSVPLFAVVGFLTGLCVAPSLVTGYTLIDALVPSRARTEAFTWLTGAVALGQAAAVTAAGRLADAHGSQAGFLVPALGTLAAFLTLALLRERLVPGGAKPPAEGAEEPAPGV